MLTLKIWIIVENLRENRTFLGAPEVCSNFFFGKNFVQLISSQLYWRFILLTNLYFSFPPISNSLIMGTTI